MKKIPYRLLFWSLLFCHVPCYFLGEHYLVPHWLPALFFTLGMVDLFHNIKKSSILKAAVLSCADLFEAFVCHLLLPIASSEIMLPAYAGYILFTIHSLLQMLIFFFLLCGMEELFIQEKGVRPARACRQGIAGIPVWTALMVLLYGIFMILPGEQVSFIRTVLGNADLLLLVYELYLISQFGVFNRILEQAELRKNHERTADAAEPENQTGQTGMSV